MLLECGDLALVTKTEQIANLAPLKYVVSFFLSVLMQVLSASARFEHGPVYTPYLERVRRCVCICVCVCACVYVCVGLCVSST